MWWWQSSVLVVVGDQRWAEAYTGVVWTIIPGACIGTWVARCLGSGPVIPWALLMMLWLIRPVIAWLRPLFLRLILPDVTVIVVAGVEIVGASVFVVPKTVRLLAREGVLEGIRWVIDVAQVFVLAAQVLIAVGLIVHVRALLLLHEVGVGATGIMVARNVGCGCSASQKCYENDKFECHVGRISRTVAA